MNAYMFPGQGSQFSGMGKELYHNSRQARQTFEKANRLLPFDLTQILFHGTAEELQQTDITQPTVFAHSIAAMHSQHAFAPDMVMGHSLGEFSALVACQCITFEDGMKLVLQRARAMKKACEANPSAMAAVIGLSCTTVEEICSAIQDEIVVVANYNCPQQVVISGSVQGVEKVSQQCKAVNAKRVVPLSVDGAFHSPLMQSACEELNQAIDATQFKKPVCPIYQNIDGAPHTDVDAITQNLKKQLTSPVQWEKTILNAAKDGATKFIECGPGKVLCGLQRKITQKAIPSESLT